MLTQGGTAVSQYENSFAKTSLSYQSDVNLGEQRVLSTCWNPVKDELQFDCAVGQKSQPYQEDNSQSSCKTL